MKTIVLDIKVPFRHEKDLKGKPKEEDSFRSKLKELQEDRRAKVAWGQLLKDYDADDVIIQAYRQDPHHPVKHEKPHLEKGLKIDEAAPPADPKDEPEQSSGKSGLLVATVHFPKKDGKDRPEEDIAKDTDDFLTRIEDIAGKKFKEHSHAYGYKTLNARGQQYDDLEAVKHHSVSVSASASCSF
jgi:hypothetical protein